MAPEHSGNFLSVLGTPWDPPQQADASGPGDGGLSLSVETTNPVTRNQISDKRVRLIFQLLRVTSVSSSHSY